MTYLLVAYDLVGDDTDSEDYERVINRIEEYADSAEVQRSTWIVKVEADSEFVCKDLRDYVRSSDRLFVAELTRQAAWIHAICGSERVKEILNKA